MRLEIGWKQIEDALPGFKGLWREIKKDTGSRVRSPKQVVLTDQPGSMCPADFSCCRRYAVDLERMMIVDRVHVSAGEWACMENNPDKEVKGIPNAAALVSCEWNDYYHYFMLTVQVKEGCVRVNRIPESLPGV